MTSQLIDTFDSKAMFKFGEQDAVRRRTQHPRVVPRILPHSLLVDPWRRTPLYGARGDGDCGRCAVEKSFVVFAERFAALVTDEGGVGSGF